MPYYLEACAIPSLPVLRDYHIILLYLQPSYTMTMPYRKKDPKETLEELRERKAALRAQFDDKLTKVDSEIRLC